MAAVVATMATMNTLCTNIQRGHGGEDLSTVPSFLYPGKQKM